MQKEHQIMNAKTFNKLLLLPHKHTKQTSSQLAVDKSLDIGL